MLSDIEIAQQNEMEKIQIIADKCGLTPDDIEQYGHYKAKISFDAIRRLEDKPDGKLVLQVAVMPKLYQWMILTSILQVICTLLQQLIIYCPL